MRRARARKGGAGCELFLGCLEGAAKLQAWSIYPLIWFAVLTVLFMTKPGAILAGIRQPNDAESIHESVSPRALSGQLLTSLEKFVTCKVLGFHIVVYY